MLTKTDLKAIGDLISRVEKNLGGRIDQLALSTREELLEIREELKVIKKAMNKDFKKVHKDQEMIIKFSNEELLNLR